MSYYLFKSEPGAFGIDDLKRVKTTIWDGVRNYQARIHLRSAKSGDRAFFYHSNCAEIGIAGVCRITETLVADPSQFDPASPYFDPKSTRDAPRWETVRVQFEERFAAVISLETLKTRFTPDELLVVRKGNRLSVLPVSDAAAQRILAIAHE